MYDNFDKIATSIAIALFIMVISINLGDALYHPYNYVEIAGYKIDTTDSTYTSSSKAIPDIIDIGSIMSTFDLEKGKKFFQSKCTACHSATKNEDHKIGPNLWNVLNRKVATAKGYSYSDAMLNKQKENVQWTYEELYRYLYAPKKRVPGTKMSFSGIKDDAMRINVIAYIRTLADSIIALPQVKNNDTKATVDTKNKSNNKDKRQK